MEIKHGSQSYLRDKRTRGGDTLEIRDFIFYRNETKKKIRRAESLKL